jgi:hypothetical protein
VPGHTLVVVCVCVLLPVTALRVGVVRLRAAENAPKLMKKFAKTSK